METWRIALTDGVVLLDRFNEDDMEAHLAGEDEEQARRFGWWPERSGPEHFRRMLAEDEAGWREGGPRLKFATRVGGRLAGGAEIRLDGEAANLSYWTFPEFRRRGFGTRSAELVCAWALGELGLERIEVVVEEDNIGSRKVAEGAGFVDTGRRNKRGLLVYELLRSDE